MIRFDDIATVLNEKAVHLNAEELQLLNKRAVNELTDRSIIGTVLVPLCYLLAILTSDYASELPGSAIVIFLAMLGLAIARIYVMRNIGGARQITKTRLLQVFFAVCGGMAVIWGGVVGAFIFRYGDGFPVLLILILSVAIGAGAVANFCIWCILAGFYLLVTFAPGVLVGFWLQRPELLPAIVAIAFYAIYMLLQLRHLNFQFWNSLLNSYLSEQQAEQLSETNQKLAVTIEKEKHFLQEVETEKAKMRELFDSAHDAMIICELEGKVLDVNKTMLKMFGSNREEIMEIAPLQLLSLPEMTTAALQERWQRTVKGMAEDFECQAVLPGGGILHVHVNFRMVTWHNDKVIFATIRDINDRKIAEKELDSTKASLSKSEAYLQAILRNVELPIYCKDLAGCFLTANKSFEILCGMSCEQLNGKNDLEIFPANIGSFFSFRDSEIIATGESLELEGVFNIGGAKKNILIHKFALKDKNGTVYATAGICSDVTVIKQALRAAQLANEAKSEFLANMSHELRTPMHSILSFARLGIKRIDSVPLAKLESFFKMIVTSGDQLLELLNDLLDISTLESSHLLSFIILRLSRLRHYMIKLNYSKSFVIFCQRWSRARLVDLPTHY